METKGKVQLSWKGVHVPGVNRVPKSSSQGVWEMWERLRADALPQTGLAETWCWVSVPMSSLSVSHPRGPSGSGHPAGDTEPSLRHPRPGGSQKTARRGHRVARGFPLLPLEHVTGTPRCSLKGEVGERTTPCSSGGFSLAGLSDARQKPPWNGSRMA